MVVAGCSSQTQVADNQILSSHALAGMEVTEIIEHLDQLDVEDRPADLMASVRVDELQLSAGTEQLSLDLPEDRFYLSFAPYVNQTHECYYHSLTTCRGELSNEDVQVTVTNDAGEVVVDEELTTFDNGFVGLWLPRNLQGTLRVSAEDGTGQVPVSTGTDDPTCLTTIQLT
ncbi:CueP family metal-binding protein [Ornithinimicrobium sp. F0845]|uniref:CueP family metal-binding protein n=1 Tax=Ornithinimicrobium sp. F0845 TaxID=2926412 RepID=UPI001FF6AAA1|nr:CueP family metal-binding protein [Ornithinimicrobium sp. F0845]MCK0111758.1 CueP family metal-binding protein [Ornithinimicrobium sp. F0845]